MQLVLRNATLTEVTEAGLIAELDAELQRRYPEEFINGIDAVRFATEGGYMAVALADGHHAGCGALSPVDRTTVELKRMYVRPAFRGNGVARQLLQHLEAEAGRRGFTHMVLETGVRQPEAQALYRSVGYTTIAPFGPYGNSARRVYLGKSL